MSNILWKHFYLCLSKLKCFPTCLPPPPPPPPSHQDDNTLQSPTLIKTFNPLSNPTTSKSHSSSTSDDDFSSSYDDDTDYSPPDFAAVFASHRFFFPSPGHSNYIVGPPDPEPVVTGGVAVHTDSPDPYADFRRSMQEMVDARKLFDVKADWEYLHELLLCYLSLNPKHIHEFIFGAFSDLLVSLKSSSKTGCCCRKSESHRRPAVSQRLM